MKRLIKLNDSEMIERLKQEVFDEINEKNDTGMILLDELDEADIRHDKCPNCKCYPIKKKDGFKICPRCQIVYKIFDGKGYIVTE